MFAVKAQTPPPDPRPEQPLRPMEDDRVLVRPRGALELHERWYCFCGQVSGMVRGSERPRFGVRDLQRGFCSKHRPRGDG